MPLKGLNIRQARGKWYVSYRLTGETLIKGFEGTRDQLDRILRGHDFRVKHLQAETRDRSPTYAEGSLGEVIKWFKEKCPRWDNLSDASREDYEKSFTYLEALKHPLAGPLYDFPIADITQPSVYAMRNQAAKDKWPRFSDKLVSHLSTIFKEAVKVGMVSSNPAGGVEKLHTADPNANHEWHEDEVQIAIWLANDAVLSPIILARYQGFRGQTCAALNWRNYVSDPKTVKAFSLVIRKNKEATWFPCAPETRTHLDAVQEANAAASVKSTRICLNSDGLPWKSEKVLQGAVSDYLAELKRAGLIREGCTLHGLRVTYAADIRRRGFDTGIVADALGDRSRRMGEHYTRHVEKELGRLKVFNQRNDE